MAVYIIYALIWTVLMALSFKDLIYLQVNKTIYQIVQSFGSRKPWRIWWFMTNLSKFYPLTILS